MIAPQLELSFTSIPSSGAVGSSRDADTRVYVYIFVILCLLNVSLLRYRQFRACTPASFLQKFAVAVNISKAVDINCAVIRRASRPESLRGCAKESCNVV